MTDPRICSKCSAKAPGSDFRTGSHVCKACRNAQSRDWNKANRDRVNESIRAYKKRNRPKVNAQKNAWNKANPEKVRAMKQRDYERHSEKIKARVNRWLKEKPGMRRAQTLKRRSLETDAAGAWYTSWPLIFARVQFYGGKCVYCGADYECIDHRIPLSRGGSHWPSNLVPACKRCNSRKHAKTEREFREVMTALHG